ncbi:MULTISPECIES: methionyl-tRNA formyltransferase [unclassified Sulfitobacter]|uniref:methionyl-tRNA formyltransferase n=1 Tax=unclassified Sulfitobacter TaxID=196795 RepID=UPI003746C8FB
MKVAVVGGVVSTEVLVQALVRHKVGEIAVWGYEPKDTSLVSGWRDLRRLSDGLGLPFEGFRKVTECEASLRTFVPDILFVVGLSQIVPPTMLNIAAKANIGFHPTALPRGRGRAALAWLILQGENGAATFFELRDGVDDGPVFVQEHFVVVEGDVTADVEAKLLEAERIALDRWLPQLAQGDLMAQEQDHGAATWYGRRTPEDGWLDWQARGDDLLRLIRSSAPPHPGAFTFCQNHKILVLKAIASDRRETGVPGRILAIHSDGGFVVQAGEGIVHVTEWQSGTGWIPKVGALLGYYAEAEIFDLRTRLARLEQTVDAMQAMMGKGGS